jgi:hypothetical protein
MEEGSPPAGEMISFAKAEIRFFQQQAQFGNQLSGRGLWPRSGHIPNGGSRPANGPGHGARF